MKKFKIYLSFLAVFALLFTSCSKDEQPGASSDSEKATLSFGAIVEDLAAKAATKQSDVGDLPACSDEVPAYVQIILMQGDVEVVGTAGAPYRVDLVEGQIFTEEDPELELTPGTYTLDHFAVYNEAGDLLWLAPKGGVLAEFVDSPLPININLGAGVKKYVDVSVICYDDRNVNEYGYLFFELDTYEAFEYCVFANYCSPDGRHYPARYSVDVSIDGVSIYSGAMNTVGTDANGDFYADPLCGALPDLPQYADDEEYIDITLTLLDWDANYGDVGTMVIEESLSRNEIMANFDGEDGVFYEHFRFGCADDGEEPQDSDNDGVIDSVDECENTPQGATVDAVGCPMDSDEDGVLDGIDECPGTEAGVDVDNKGCPVTQETDSDNDGVIDSIDECENTPEGATVNAVGCPSDSDDDGVLDGIDQCPGTESGAAVDDVGCIIDETCQTPNVCHIPQTNDDLEADCYFVYPDFTDQNAFVAISEDSRTVTLENSFQDEFGSITLTGTLAGGYTLSIDGILNTDRVIAYEVEVLDDLGDTCSQSFCDEDVEVVVVNDDQQPVAITLNNSVIDDSTIYIRVKAIICETPIGTPE